MKNLLVIVILMISYSLSYGQKERSYNRTGVKDYLAGDYNDAELDFMKALEYDSTSFAANYNTASTLYKLGKYGEANEILAKLANSSESQEHLPDMLHNLGNNFMKQEMYDKSVEAYKNSLRLRPDDDETRYNLSYAQAKLKQQEQENKDKDNKDNKDNKDKDKQDEKNKDENQEKQDQEDQQQDQDQQQNQDEKKDQQQPQENKELSKEDVERILQAIQQQEKEVKEKVDKEKAKVKKVKTEKDW